MRAGHVVTVEPGLYYLGLGGVRIEDVALVTRAGSRCLTRVPKQLEI
jgi:Xaa-Pro aminopeptidase